MSSLIQNKFHTVIGDGARASKFNFYIPPLSGGDVKITDIIAYSVKSVDLPTVEHTPIKIMIKGHPIPVKGSTTYSQEFEVEFYSDEAHAIKRFFEDWIVMLEQRHYYYNPRINNARLAEINTIDYEYEDITWFPTLFVEQRNYDGDQVLAVYQIFNCFPISVSGFKYDHSQVNTVLTFTVKFSYSHYKLHSSFPRYFGHNSRFETTGDYPRVSEAMSQVHKVTAQNKPDFEFNVDRFKKQGFFYQQNGTTDGLEQTSAKKSIIWWRSYELARWNNLWNRWAEARGENANAGQKINDGYNLDDEDGSAEW